MFKHVIAFLLGAVVGVGIMYYGPEKIQKDAEKGLETTKHVVKTELYDRCVSQFYRDTNCLQLSPSKVCEQEIVNLCGPLPKGGVQ